MAGVLDEIFRGLQPHRLYYQYESTVRVPKIWGLENIWGLRPRTPP